MDKSLAIFGGGAQAEVAEFYFGTVGRRVECFVVDDDYVAACSRRPVIGLSQAVKTLPPRAFDFHVAVGYSKLNRVREAKCAELAALGYELASFVSPAAEVHGAVGRNCFILEHNTVQPFVRIGEGVVLWSGNHIGHHSEIGDYAFLTSHVVVSGGCRVGRRSFIGVNSTLRDKVSVGEACVVGAGSLVLKDVADGCTWTHEGLSKVPAGRVRL